MKYGFIDACGNCFCMLLILLVTGRFNESNQFAGNEDKMAYVVREPIVRGMVVTINMQTANVDLH